MWRMYVSLIVQARICLSYCFLFFYCLTHRKESLSERHCSSCQISQEQSFTSKVLNIKCASAHRFRLEWENAKKILLHILLRQSGIRWSVSSRCQFTVKSFQALGRGKIFKTIFFSVCCTTLRFLFSFTLTARCRKISAFWGFLQSNQVLPVLLAICKDRKHSTSVWNTGGFALKAYQNLLANAALSWILPVTAVQQTAGNMTHCGGGLNIWLPLVVIPLFLILTLQALSSSAQLSHLLLSNSNKLYTFSLLHIGYSCVHILSNCPVPQLDGTLLKL